MTPELSLALQDFLNLAHVVLLFVFFYMIYKFFKSVISRAKKGISSLTNRVVTRQPAEASTSKEV